MLTNEIITILTVCTATSHMLRTRAKRLRSSLEDTTDESSMG